MVCDCMGSHDEGTAGSAVQHVPWLIFITCYARSREHISIYQEAGAGYREKVGGPGGPPVLRKEIQPELVRE